MTRTPEERAAVLADRLFGPDLAAWRDEDRPRVARVRQHATAMIAAAITEAVAEAYEEAARIAEREPLVWRPVDATLETACKAIAREIRAKGETP